MLNGPEGMAVDDSSVIVDDVRVDLKIAEVETETKQIEALKGEEFVRAALDSLDSELTPENRIKLENGDLESVEPMLRSMLFVRLEAKKQMRDGLLKLQKAENNRFINPTFNRLRATWKPENVKAWLVSNRAVHERAHIPENVRRRLGEESLKVGKVNYVYRWFKLEEKVNELNSGPEKKAWMNRLYSEKITDVVPALEEEFRQKDILTTEKRGDELIDKMMRQ